MGQIEINIIIGIMLFLCVIKDIKKKEISHLTVVIAGIAILFILVAGKNNFTWNRLGGGLVGGMIMAISKLSKGQIGMGDGIVLVVTGIGMGLWNNISILAYGLFFACVFSFSLLIGKKISPKDTVPFVPFLSLGYLCVLLFN